MKQTRIVAITGQSGTGKSSFSKIYTDLGYTVIDCDKIASEVHKNKECQQLLVQAFGEEILSDNQIDRKKLSQKAFQNASSLEQITNITHPFIIQKLLEIIAECEKQGQEIVFVDGAVIVGHTFEQYCEKFIVVVSDKNLQYTRLISRDHISLAQAENRIAQQTNLSVLLKKADYVVYNNKTLQELKAQALCILQNL